MVKPNPISDSDVRTTLISVRSALSCVRWIDIAVRREESSTAGSSDVRSGLLAGGELSAMSLEITVDGPHARRCSRRPAPLAALLRNPGPTYERHGEPPMGRSA